MRRYVNAGDIPYSAVCTPVSYVIRLSTRVPVEKETRPAMMVHGLGLADWGQRDFQNAHQRVFENHSVTVGGGLCRIVAIGESGFLLWVGDA